MVYRYWIITFKALQITNVSTVSFPSICVHLSVQLMTFMFCSTQNTKQFVIYSKLIPFVKLTAKSEVRWEGFIWPFALYLNYCLLFLFHSLDCSMRLIQPSNYFRLPPRQLLSQSRDARLCSDVSTVVLLPVSRCLKWVPRWKKSQRRLPSLRMILFLIEGWLAAMFCCCLIS